MAPGGDRSSSRRARSGANAHHGVDSWRGFAVAIVVTSVLIVAVGAFAADPFHDLFADGGARTAAASHTVPGAAGSSVAPVTTTAPVTTVPATTTTTTPSQRVPGLGLLPQPAPTPVALPPTNLAPAFSRIPTTNKVIFLGIDDGIVRDPAVLDLLRKANIPFTMFLVQSEAHAGTDYFHQLEQVGGVVESHTINHPDLTKVSGGQLQTEVCGTLDDYQALFGRRPTLFRPPYGTYNDNVRAVAASCGYKAVILWKGSTNDGRFDLQEGTQLQPGDIVLMHFRNDLLANLQKVFDVCKQQGFAIGSLQDYLPG